jgi:hypothetical protein
MSEPIIERLTQFTPDGSGIDRDALLFAAGRASARPNRRWHLVCAALVTTQLLTLGLAFWPRPVDHLPGRALPRIPVVRAAPLSPGSPPGPGTAPLWQQRNLAITTDGKLPMPAPIDNLTTSEPPLHAFGTLPVSLLD